MAPIARYPLFCDFREIVFGKKFVAGVKICARLMAEHDAAQGWWIYGVTPLAIAESGPDLSGAVNNFRSRLKGVFFDFAAEAPDIEAFAAEVQQFFKQTDPETEAEWEAARKAVREGKIHSPSLQKETTDRVAGAKVVALKMEPRANVLDPGPSLAS